LGDVIRLVVVDDEDEVRTLLRTRLGRDGGFEVVGETADAAEAAGLCASLQPHAVVLDAGVPNREGLQAVPDIRRAAPHAVIVIYTSDPGLATRDEAERVGAHAVVGKLDPFEWLTGTIERFVRGRPHEHDDPDRKERAEFGQRMNELLATEDERAAAAPWWRRPGKTRVGFVVLLVLVVLPLLAFLAWVVAQLAGLVL
jgi:DNA-binding NarL/FixJ family response regulator